MRLIACLLLTTSLPLLAQITADLPPQISWDGRSQQLIVHADHPWITPAEQTDLVATPTYEETLDWLSRLVESSRVLSWEEIGRTDMGRPIMAVRANSGAKNWRPTLLAHGGIHAGEIDGKDAGLMLLRDMVDGGPAADLLDAANLIFIPVLNPDGHERISEHGRVNQRGPKRMGWRTNARNLNLNRDFAKLDTPEVRALIRLILEEEPDLYLDLHVTDGADYQYDITYGFNEAGGWSPEISDWLSNTFRPAIDSALSRAGHIPGPLVFAVNGRDMADGNLLWTAGPRFSNGWGDARHLPTVLVENHSLKNYRQRVLGTRVMLEAAMRILGSQHASLGEAVRADKARRAADVPLAFGVDPEAIDTVEFAGISSRVELSPISGAPVVRWTGEPVSLEVARLPMSQITASAERPTGYYIPPSWHDLVDRLQAQGIQAEKLDEITQRNVEQYRLPNATLGDASFEGQVLVSPGEIEVAAVTMKLPAGGWIVSTDQPLGTLAMLLLEPASPDSYFQWGLMLEMLQRTEYIEGYVIEPLAAQMLANDEALANEFNEKLMNDSEFSGDASARLEWFYRRSPYYDQQYGVYPILRLIGQ